MKRTVFLLFAFILLFTSCGSDAGVTASTETRRDTEAPGSTAAAVTTEKATEKATEKEENEMKTISFGDSEEIIISGHSWAPRVCSADGALLAGVETSKGIRVFRSEDGGLSWKDPAAASFYPDLNCANVNFYLDGERLYLAYRATSDRNGVRYTSLRVSASDDGGRTWVNHSTVCEYTDAGGRGGVWEPYLIRIGDRLYCFYANDHPSVSGMQNIECKVWNGKVWTGRKIVSNGEKHDSRDGMPVVCKTSDGGYVCVIESSAERYVGHPFVLKMLYSEDGGRWGEPVTVYTPKTKGSKAAAPGVVCLPDGRLVISFQTDEDATVKGDGTSVMKFIVSDGTAARGLTSGSFTSAENIFGTPDGESSVWTGIYYENGAIYAAAGTKKGSSLKIAFTR
ncbi:MAG: exo-alpha-sialidase [Clostridia bacterium]|nr:exo-alpha-sialidase [Clostridia bacterium]